MNRRMATLLVLLLTSLFAGLYTYLTMPASSAVKNFESLAEQYQASLKLGIYVQGPREIFIYNKGLEIIRHQAQDLYKELSPEEKGQVDPERLAFIMRPDDAPRQKFGQDFEDTIIRDFIALRVKLLQRQEATRRGNSPPRLFFFPIKTRQWAGF